jgi:hypothetical protein
MESEVKRRPTMSVVEAGRTFFGLGEGASYAAARAGEIPCVRIGNRWFACVGAIERMIAEAGKARTRTAEINATTEGAS